MNRLAVLSVLAASIVAGCEPPPVWDNQPPRLLEAAVAASGRELELEFDEPVAEAATGGNFSTAAPATSVEGERVTVELPRGLKPGKDYRWTAEVKDAGRNLTSVTGRFYGPNDHPAELRLNEVRVAGSGQHTDLVELRVERDGNLGGWTLDAYSTPDSRQRLVLPDRLVAAGQMVVIHYRPSGDSAEVDETATADASGGSDADPQAWDFWQPGGKGLSAVKGLVALRPHPDAPPSDALLYSRDAGAAAALAEAARWPGRDELNPEGCTATRTWSRTDATAEWIITANGGATPGRANSLMAWEGPTSSRKRPPKSRRQRHRSAKASDRGSPNAPGSTCRPGGRAKRRPHGPTRAVTASRGESTLPFPSSRTLPAPEVPSQRPRCRGATVRRVLGRDRGGGGEEDPPPRAAPYTGPPRPGSGRGGGLRRVEARLFD